MQPTPPKSNNESETVRARVDLALKEQWEDWCARSNITPSQGLRWLLQMHMSDPSKVWAFLANNDKTASSSGTAPKEETSND